METAVGGILIFGAALGAHLERGHCGSLAVVGSGFDDREPWAAVGTVDERIQVPVVLWIVKVEKAVIAGGYVGGDKDGAVPGLVARFAGLNAEAAFAAWLLRLLGYSVDFRQRWRVGGKDFQE